MLLSNFTYAQNTIYVNDNATGANDGTSWNDAFTDLQDANAIAVPFFDKIWVKEGTYRPDSASPGDRNLSFEFKRDIFYFGGFPDTTTNNINPIAYPSLHPSILSGDIGIIGDSTDNSYHVTVINPGASFIHVDGFEVTEGNADAPSSTDEQNAAGCKIFSTGGNTDMFFYNMNFSENHANGFGGGVNITANTFGTSTISLNISFFNCSFSSNTVNVTPGHGAGIIISSVNVGATTNVNFNACNLNGNSASTGGAIYLKSQFGGILNSTFFGCNINNNTATGNGGAIYEFVNSGSTLKTDIIFGSINSNLAANGGGIYSDITDGIYQDSLFNVGFGGNTATQSGGAISCQANNSTLTPIFDNCDFINNSSSFSGGAIENQSDNGGSFSPKYSDCLFFSNYTNSSTSGKGGAIANLSGSGPIDPEFIACNFWKNTSRSGGAMYNEGFNNSNRPTIVNCIFNENKATNFGTEGWGGALFNEGSVGVCETTIINSSFSDNEALTAGQAIRNEDAPTTIANSILWGGISPDIISETMIGNTTVTYSDIEGGYTGTGNINQLPQFTDAPNNDFTLLQTSPCINTGINDSLPSGITKDFYGEDRIQNTTIDMGASENFICPIYIPDYTEDFSTYLPLCWVEKVGGIPLSTPPDANSTWTEDAFGNIGSTNNSAKVRIYGDFDNTNDWLMSPQFDLTTGGPYLLTFDIALTENNSTNAATLGSDDQIFLVADSDGSSVNQILQTWTSSNSISATGDSYTFDLSSYSSSTLSFGFQARGGNTIDPEDNDFFVDNFAITACATATYYLDSDGDGYGDAYHSGDSYCIGFEPPNYVSDNTDCDDSDPGDTDITVSGNPIVSDHYIANRQIMSSDSVDAGGMTIFQAGEEIILSPDFVASSGTGSDFIAFIDPECPLPFSPLTQEETEEEVDIFKEKITPSESQAEKPQQATLAIYPNPTKRQTNIVFTIPQIGVNTLEVYNNTGTLVKRLAEGKWLEQGEYIESFETEQLPAGIYLIVLRTAKRTITKKLIVIE